MVRRPSINRGTWFEVKKEGLVAIDSPPRSMNGDYFFIPNDPVKIARLRTKGMEGVLYRDGVLQLDDFAPKIGNMSLIGDIPRPTTHRHVSPAGKDGRDKISTEHINEGIIHGEYLNHKIPTIYIDSDTTTNINALLKESKYHQDYKVLPISEASNFDQSLANMANSLGWSQSDFRSFFYSCGYNENIELFSYAHGFDENKLKDLSNKVSNNVLTIDEAMFEIKNMDGGNKLTDKEQSNLKGYFNDSKIFNEIANRYNISDSERNELSDHRHTIHETTITLNGNVEKTYGVMVREDIHRDYPHDGLVSYMNKTESYEMMFDSLNTEQTESETLTSEQIQSIGQYQQTHINDERFESEPLDEEQFRIIQSTQSTNETHDVITTSNQKNNSQDKSSNNELNTNIGF